MIVELGHFALVLALMVAVLQASLPLLGAQLGRPRWMALGDSTATAQALLAAAAFVALSHAFAVSDFSVAVVARNSHTDKPLLYKITGVWANHEGSLLLWVTLLALFGAAVALFGRNLPPSLRARVLAVQGMVGAGFLSFVLLTSNPFQRLLPAPANGDGLNPLLQDPGLAFHPPFLYLGYVGFSVAFSFAVAALIEGRVDAAWARWVRPWTLAAWAFLTCGIGLGSWWAYYELGWGGWWYWDPVENASFMPWLVGTALLHSAIVVEKRESLKTWTILLAIITFGFSLLGTFLVRSGVITSVHSFAADPGRGLFVLMLLCVSVGGSLTLYAVRAPRLKSGGLFAPVSREGTLLINNLLMTLGAATVLLGTLFPLLADALELGKVSVGAPFFNAVFVPLMIPMVALMAVGPLLAWKRGAIVPAVRRLRPALLAAGLSGAMALGFGGPWWAACGMALAAWLLVGSLAELAGRIRSLGHIVTLPRAVWGMTLTHAGLALVIAGITASSAWKVERVQTMRPGEMVAVAGYTYRLIAVDQVPGPNYSASRATFTVERDGRMVTVLRPEKRQYSHPPRPTTEAAIHTTWFGDLYAVIGEPAGDGAHVARLYWNPLVPWMWFGGLVMVAGALVSLSDRRHRVGSPARARDGAKVPARA